MEIVDSGRESNESSGSLRPIRSTRGVSKCYKELSVNAKMRRGDELINVKKERISEVGSKPITISKVQSLAEEKEKQTKRSSSNSSNQEDAKKVKVSFQKLNLNFFY